MMHENEVSVPDELARRLVDTQLPQHAALPLRRLPPIGTDHHLFRLGDNLLVRLPRIDWAAAQAHSDDTWLRRLAPHLPLEVPVPIVLGEPAEGYPFAWSVVPWIEGENATDDNVDWSQAARGLGDFLRTLRGIDPMDGPLKTDGARGTPLIEADEWVRTWTERAGDRVDRAGVLEAWEDSLAAPTWDGPPVWLNGDVHEGNVIVRDRRLAAVIDWGGLGLGDPAVELNAAWTFIPPHAVPTYVEALGLDEAAWRRGRGWALQPSISGLVYYEQTAPELARACLATVERVVADLGSR